MDFFKNRKFRKSHKPNPEKDGEDKPIPHPEHPRHEKIDVSNKSDNLEGTPEMDDDDDDFITNEVKRRLKELRRNSFLVLIPEESCIGGDEEEEGDGEQEEGETTSSEWRDLDADGRYTSWFGFDAIYEKYCERMLFFDRMSVQHLKEIVGSGSQIPSTPSPRSGSKKLASPFRCLSLKKIEEPKDDETKHLHQPCNDAYQDLETVYVAQVCLTWEALHCQYTQLIQRMSCQMEDSMCYNHSAQEFQQFQVLLQRCIENEPFEQGLRAEIYARARHSWPKLLQVPKVQGSDKTKAEEESDYLVLAPDLLRVIESSILTFYIFLKMDKKKLNGVLSLLGGQNQIVTPHQQVQGALEKKKMRLKEVRKKKKDGKNKAWPSTYVQVELLFGLIDIKIMSRVLRMERITKDMLLWSEDKMKKLDFSGGKLHRDPSPILFPF